MYYINIMNYIKSDTINKLFPIKGYEGIYSITRNGRMWAHDRTRIINGFEQKYKGRWLLSTPDGNGYIKRVLTKNGKQESVIVHRLVAQAFIPNPENKPYINHKNLIRADNRVENLEWCTALENVTHSKANGNYAIKLTQEQIDEIRENHDPTTSCKNKAWKRYGIGSTTYYHALNKEFSYENT